ncbi:MAG: Por secretion system protein [Prevotella sp.]|nr:Por secretion system protein [Prevotella sp.]
MKKTIIFLLLSIVNCQLSIAQVGTWHNYLAYHDVQQIQDAGNDLFVLASNALYQYHKSDQSITTYDKVNGLTDTNITHIRWCQQAKRLIAVYSNMNIDLVETNGNVTNISDVYTKAIIGDKTVNSIYTYNQYAYLACGFGIVKIDVKRAEISESYMLDRNVTDVAVSDNHLYAKIVDKKTTLAGTPVIPYGFTTINLDSLEAARYKTEIITYYIKGSLSANLIDAGQWEKSIYDESSRFVKDNSDYDKYIDLVKTLKPGGPDNNHVGFLRFTNNHLYSCGGIPGGNFIPTIPGNIQVWDGSDWTIYQNQLETTTGHSYMDLATLDADPHDATHVFAGGRTGLYEFKNGKFLKEYNYDNSELLTTAAIDAPSKDYTMVQTVKYDNNGSLWILNSGSPSTSLFEITREGQWISHDKKEFYNSSQRAYDNMVNAFFDSRGILWFCNCRFVEPAVICYQKSTDVAIAYKKFVNQDGSSIDLKDDGIYCLAEDKESNIWIGTTAGPIVIMKDQIGKSADEIVFTQVKVPRNDGTNYADYLLAGNIITSIAVDEGGRKWFATSSNGVYLISADNMTQIQHFTTDNSPLLSNNVQSVTINSATGEVFFGTENGLCSYISDATQTNEEMTSDNVWAYPNPVNPGYSGPITITGLSYNADVKILSANGALVFEGQSNGGIFVWYGSDLKGRRVASGVYMVVTATSTGEKGTVCKIAIVN